MAKDYYVWMLPVGVTAETATAAINRVLGKGAIGEALLHGMPYAVAMVATTERPVIAPNGRQQRGSGFVPLLEKEFVNPTVHMVDRAQIFTGTLEELVPFEHELELLEVEKQLKAETSGEEAETEIPF